MMTNFTVDVTTEPIQDGDWTKLRSVLEAVPGSVLIEDPLAPELMIPVDAESAMKAATFVDGLSQLIEFHIVGGEIRPTEEADFDAPEDDDAHSALTTATITIQGWVNDIPPVQPRSGRHAMA
jgi:hypothetical protein